MINIVIKVAASFIACMAFGVVFGVRRQNLVFAGLCGGIGGAVYLVALQMGWGNVAALLAAGLGIALCSEVLARLRHCPATVFQIAGLIPLVPGGRIYLAMQLMLTGVPGEAAMMLYTMLLEAGALALGILLVSSFTALRKKRAAGQQGR